MRLGVRMSQTCPPSRVVESGSKLRRTPDASRLRCADSSLCQVEEYDRGGITDRGIMPGEEQAASVAMRAEHGHVVSTLVAGIEELAGGIEIKAAWIVSSRPFLADKGG